MGHIRIACLCLIRWDYRARSPHFFKWWEYVTLELKEDDIVVIGSPIWNDRLSTPINAVLDQFAFDKDTTGFILYPAGEGTKKSFKQIEKLGYQKQPVIVAHPLKKPERVKELLSTF